MSQAPTPPDFPQERASGCLVRLCWMVLGNLALIVLARSIWLHEGSFLCLADLGFWLTVLAMAALRYVDVARLGGRTVYGQPATLRHWRLYALVLGLAALALWGLAHGAAYIRSRP